MTSAALLAKLGRRVLVLEQHYVPGGFTHEFRRKGWRWDVGVHAVGEVTEHTFTGRLLAHLTDGRLRWASLGPVYEEFYWPDGTRIDFPDDPARFRETLARAFPGREDAIDRYFSAVREVGQAMRGHYLARTLPRGIAPIADRILAGDARRALSRTTAEVLAEITDDERLKAALVSQWGYYGLPPSRSAFAVHALVARHFAWGGYYPVGGGREIARSLLRTVADAGGWTCIHADVAQILVEGGRATGVQLADGARIAARRVVSAVGILATVRRLLPTAAREAAWVGRVEGERPGPAHVCLYLGFRGDIRAAGAGAANKWFIHTTDVETEAWDVDEHGPRGDAPLLYCSFPSLKDPEHDPGPRQLHTGEVVTFVPWRVFAPFRRERWQRRSPAYQRLKQALHDRILEQYLRHLPQLRPMIAHSELSTPVSTEHFVRSVDGSIYGLAPSPERYRDPHLRARSPIPGLYFSGSDVVMGGVVGAMMGGVLAALAAEPVRGIRLMSRVWGRPS
jgi:all-trans-retinol 13,14-reductase